MIVLAGGERLRVQEKDMEEFGQKYNEAMVTLQDAVTRFTDNLSLWGDQWRHLTDAEKTTFCSTLVPASTDAETAHVDPPPPGE